MERCQKHPKYKGRKKPKNQCNGCLALYSSYGMVLAARSAVVPRPQPPMRDKKKYTRKKRIKDEDV